MKFLAKGSFGALLLTAAMSVAAFPVNLVSVDGTFQNAFKSNGSLATGNSTSLIHWGDSRSQSSYEFNGSTSLPMQIDDSSIFSLGELTHTNNQVAGSTLASTDLAIALGFSGFGETGVQQGTFIFAHDETLDNGTYKSCWWIFCRTKYDGPVDDTITQTGVSVTSSSFTLGGFEYSLELLGFDKEFTGEGDIGVYELNARLNATALPVPEPGTIVLLGLGLAGLGMARRRKA